MLLSLIVNTAPDEGQSAWTAYRFACQALADGHSLYRVFFYHGGVVNGCAARRPAQDETDITRLWQALADEYALDLVVCISAAKRRGIFDEAEAERQQAPANLARGFTLSGLGQYTDALISSDRLISFGG